MRHQLLFISSLMALNACAYTFDTTIQDLRIETPGAQEARCMVYVEGLRFSYRPPQTQTIPKSDEDLVVDCMAPGNRRQEVIIKAKTVETLAYDYIFPPALLFDYVSGASHEYPSVLVVDFTNAKPIPEKLPAQNNPDIRQPESYKLEEFKAGFPKLNEDENRRPVVIQRRERKIVPPPQFDTNIYEGAPASISDSPSSNNDVSVPAEMQPAINPAGEPNPSASEE